ncbi:DUF4055 domain-containing protein, partial [Glaesserella parasuis]|nr:DUF4055 domain-containing protein [Glaesserella parasuis]
LKELESQMRVAGAKLLDKTVLAMTDSQAKEEQGKEISLLRLYANKFEDALDLALEYVGLWLGIDDVGSSHCLRGCKLRFGANAILPFGGFPSTTQYGA